MIWFIFLGFLGGVTHIIIESRDFSDLIKFDSMRTYIIGIIVGFLYDILYSDYNFPNLIMCWVAGYTGVDFIKRILERFQNQD